MTADAPDRSSHRIDAEARPYDPDQLPRKDEVAFDAFLDLDLRVGRVTNVQPFPEARDPAWKLTVDFGPLIGELRTSAKVTEYPAEELVGRQVVGAINLGRKRIAGFVSEFLVLGGLEADGRVRLLAPDADLPPGSVVA
ncbi:MAG: tRNA-binding protein [Nitriliruptor sp.]|uniref:tRNA-binding protein n=1 Tax=Nitriliruptor sp. TaxID=2448056 RepID=UPI00349FDFC2